MQFNKLGNISQSANEIKNIDIANELHIGNTYNVKVKVEVEAKVEVDELTELRKKYPQYSDKQLRSAKKMLFGNCKIMRISEKLR